MTKDEALKLALEAWQTSVYGSESHHKAMLLAMTNMAQALAAPVPTVIGMRDAKYLDSTPRLHVGNSAFEDWFQAQPFATQTGTKQISRDSYAAGMGDPLVTYAAQPAPVQEPVALEAVYEAIIHWDEGGGKRSRRELARRIVALYTNPPAQEFVCSTGLCHFTLTQTNVGIGKRATEAYEAAKKRGWVGVSDERLMEMPEQEPVAIVSGYYGGQCVVLPTDPARLFNSGTAFYTTPPAAQRQWVGLTDEEMYEIVRSEGAVMKADARYIVEKLQAKLKEKNT